MKKFKIIGIIFISIVAIMQLYPSNLPGIVRDNPNDLLANNPLNDSISSMLKNSCYDCHSNVTIYPWYSHIAPVSWLVGRDTKVGREHLNFSEWESYSLKLKLKALNEIAENVESNEMPFPPYLIIHKNAKLTESEKTLLINWTEQFSEYILK